MSKKEQTRLLAKVYYSNPKIREAIFSFSKNREVVPRYLGGGFGKRPDALQYPSDLIGLAQKGATSFHASEELWSDPFKISSDMSVSELESLRKSWDLLIDIDSPYLDYSRIATMLIIEELEKNMVKNYGIKFSGSKGFHIIVPANSFPLVFEGIETRKMFPEWPRAISEFLMSKIKRAYNKEVTRLGVNFEAVKERTKLSKEDITEINCPNCGEKAEKTLKATLECDRCNNIQVRPKHRKTKRKLKCIEESCPGHYVIKEEKDMFACGKCGYSSFDKTNFQSRNVIKHEKEARQSKYSDDFQEEISGSALGTLDLVLVSSRHLFRMPYSLHEKTALSSIVLKKEQIPSFSPKDADPLKVEVRDFYPVPEPEEATMLLQSALIWKKMQGHEEYKTKKKYAKYDNKIDLSDVPEELFPLPIKKLLKGLKEGKKRGLFILITFLRSLNFSPEYINKKIREWNKKNDPPLKEGYLKSQIDWHLKQKKLILPPNYSNDSFYRDLQLLDKKPKEKNPVSEILRKARSSGNARKGKD